MCTYVRILKLRKKLIKEIETSNNERSEVKKYIALKDWKRQKDTLLKTFKLTRRNISFQLESFV